MRRKLISSLRSNGIRDERVLEAMERIPRHLFLDKAFDDWAYRDVPFPIGNEQTISQPYTVAFQSELLQVKPKDRILEIGTGSGYQACVLYEMGAKVYSVERMKPLFERTHDFLIRLGYNGIRTFLGDGNEGLLRYGPYDGILATAGSSDVPKALLDQLAIGGRLVIPVGGSDSQKMIRITSRGNGQFEKEDFGDFRFVPFLSGIDDGG